MEKNKTPKKDSEEFLRRGFKKEFKRFFKNSSAIVGAVIVSILVFTALFAPFLAPNDPYSPRSLRDAFQGPSQEFPLGTDQLGRCLLSRIIYGTRISLTVGIVVQAISIFIGVVLGLLAGYWGGRVDDIISILINTMFGFPGFLFALAVVTALGPGLYNMFIALGLVGWPIVARVVRGQVLSVKNIDYVQAARALGCRDLRVLIRHILPQCISPVLVLGTVGMATAIMAEAGLSFLGLGAQPPTPSWGSIIARGRDYIWDYPWITTFPGIAIFFTVLGFNLLGDGLRDFLDPRL